MSNGGKLYTAVLAAAGAILTYQLFIPPIVGLADQGDFVRTIGRFGYGPQHHGSLEYVYVEPKYIPDPSYRPSSQAQFAARKIHLHLAKAAALRLRFPARAPQQRLDARAQFARAEGLGDVIVRAQFQPHHFFGFVRFGRQHQDRRFQPRAPQFPAHLEPVLARQHHVQQNQIEAALARPPRRRYAVARHLHLVALHLQIVFQPQRDRRFVFHNQNAAHDSSSAGSTTVNVLPAPGVLSTRISPWCAAMMCFTIASPTPDPFTLAAAAALPRTNFRKIVLRSAAVIPSPSSRTRIATCARSSPHCTQIAGCSGEYFSALSIRLRSTTESASGSALMAHVASGPLSSIRRPNASCASNSPATRCTRLAVSISSNRYGRAPASMRPKFSSASTSRCSRCVSRTSVA